MRVKNIIYTYLAKIQQVTLTLDTYVVLQKKVASELLVYQDHGYTSKTLVMLPQFCHAQNYLVQKCSGELRQVLNLTIVWYNHLEEQTSQKDQQNLTKAMACKLLQWLQELQQLYKFHQGHEYAACLYIPKIKIRIKFEKIIGMDNTMNTSLPLPRGSDNT